jgi:hypothetical protein
MEAVEIKVGDTLFMYELHKEVLQVTDEFIIVQAKGEEPTKIMRDSGTVTKVIHNKHEFDVHYWAFKKFKDWLSENFVQKTKYYYDRVSDNETFSIKEIEMKYSVEFGRSAFE